MIPLLVVVLVAGCSAVARGSASYGGVRFSDDLCQTLLNQRDAAQWGAGFAAGIAGVGAFSSTVPEDETRATRLGLGISSLVAAAGASSLAALAAVKSREFETYCSQSPQQYDGSIPVEVVEPLEAVDVDLVPMEWDGGPE